MDKYLHTYIFNTYTYLCVHNIIAGHHLGKIRRIHHSTNLYDVTSTELDCQLHPTFRFLIAGGYCQYCQPQLMLWPMPGLAVPLSSSGCEFAELLTYRDAVVWVFLGRATGMVWNCSKQVQREHGIDMHVHAPHFHGCCPASLFFAAGPENSVSAAFVQSSSKWPQQLPPASGTLKENILTNLQIWSANARTSLDQSIVAHPSRQVADWCPEEVCVSMTASGAGSRKQSGSNQEAIRKHV